MATASIAMLTKQRITLTYHNPSVSLGQSSQDWGNLSQRCFQVKLHFWQENVSTKKICHSVFHTNLANLNQAVSSITSIDPSKHIPSFPICFLVKFPRQKMYENSPHFSRFNFPWNPISSPFLLFFFPRNPSYWTIDDLGWCLINNGDFP